MSIYIYMYIYIYIYICIYTHIYMVGGWCVYACVLGLCQIPPSWYRVAMPPLGKITTMTTGTTFKELSDWWDEVDNPSTWQSWSIKYQKIPLSEGGFSEMAIKLDILSPPIHRLD